MILKFVVVVFDY